MNLKQLKTILKDEPKYRILQAEKAVFVDLVDDWQQVTTLPKDLREKLNKMVNLEIKGKVIESTDKKVIKAIINLSDDKKIETVLMQHKDNHNTVCLSSQVGCAMGCLFCATGKMGFSRNLQVDEIIDQVLFWARYLQKKNKKVTNLVFMGMGEPFLNYDNVIKAIQLFNNKNLFNIGARNISISTIGIPQGINQLAKEPLQLNLAISLHAPTDNLRSKIIPLNNKYPLRDIINSAKQYIDRTNRRIMFEYIMIKDFNDQEMQANKLVNLFNSLPKKLYLINLILYNPGDFPDNKFQPSNSKQLEIFKHVLGRNKINVTERYRMGRGINAACGQLIIKK